MGYGDRNVQNALRKHGGLLPMNIVDADTGKAVYDNRDATAMAKRYAANGAAFYHASEQSLKDSREEREYFLNELMTSCTCPSCKQTTRLPYTSAYLAWLIRPRSESIFDEDLDVRDFWYCDHCNTRNEILDLPEDETERSMVLSKIEELHARDKYENLDRYELKKKK